MINFEEKSLIAKILIPDRILKPIEITKLLSKEA